MARCRPMLPSGLPAARLGLVEPPAYPLLWTSGWARGAPRSRDLVPEVHPRRESSTPLQFSISAAAGEEPGRVRVHPPEGLGVRTTARRPHPHLPHRHPDPRPDLQQLQPDRLGTAPRPAPRPPAPAGTTPPAARRRSRRRTTGVGWQRHIVWPLVRSANRGSCCSLIRFSISPQNHQHLAGLRSGARPADIRCNDSYGGRRRFPGTCGTEARQAIACRLSQRLEECSQIDSPSTRGHNSELSRISSRTVGP